MSTEETRVIRVGWLAFEGIGRPYEGWRRHPNGTWQVAGRALTKRGARRKAMRLPAVRDLPDFSLSSAPAST